MSNNPDEARPPPLSPSDIMTLALKAQAQSRATLQTLVEMKTPKHVAFVKQANIAQNQQVNNGADPSQSRAEKSAIPPTELLEQRDGNRMDTRATGTAGRVDSDLEAVGAVDRAEVG